MHEKEGKQEKGGRQKGWEDHKDRKEGRGRREGTNGTEYKGWNIRNVYVYLWVCIYMGRTSVAVVQHAQLKEGRKEERKEGR
jgi:hypothetical protein